jgi:hypothetical protein
MGIVRQANQGGRNRLKVHAGACATENMCHDVDKVLAPACSSSAITPDYPLEKKATT